MNHQAEIGEKLPENPKRIWLAPACNLDERSWCEDDIGACDECDEPTVEYRRADLVADEIERLTAEVARLRADNRLLGLVAGAAKDLVENIRE